ncbi:hypothetical protein CJO88_20270 (plasmid) [Ralstonia solanacearum]|nr:hypothetical protein CJO88_20270 [Ralstonia solanacearum]
MVTRFLPAYSASEKLVCFFIVVGPLRELPSATSSATSAMTAEPDKSAFPKERVGKLTVKMTVVMVLTLLPALLIITAGPGFMSVTRSLHHSQPSGGR